MTSRIIASYPPCRAISSPSRPSAAMSTANPSACSPRRSADASRASSSTTSNRTTPAFHAPAAPRGSSQRGHSAPGGGWVAGQREVDIVNVFRSRPALRWLVPTAAAVVVIGGGAAAGTIVASADPALPDRSAAQLLVDLQTARPAGLSGTVVETADLGLPALPGMSGGQGGADLTKLITGSNTARVWYAGEDKVRLALLGTLGETDVIRSGSDVWIWR